jgi:hypothetical protein
VRSEQEKWKVPESDPAGQAEQDRLAIPRKGRGGQEAALPGERGNLIFCGMCGGLNPTTNYYCAACGTTLVDAFHASEGLRVFELPDAASRIIEIVPAGSELDIVEDPDAPSDYVRIRLPYGRLGYIRLAEVDALTSAPVSSRVPSPDINTHARGCVSPVAALGSVALLLMLSTFGLYLLSQEGSADSGFLLLVTCFVVAPLAILMIFLYLMARDREERFEEEATEVETNQG